MLNSVWHWGDGVHKDFESSVSHSFTVERHRVSVHFGQARVLHYLGVDFVTMRSRLERDPRKNNGLVRCGVDQTRERSLTFDVEVLADAFPIFQGAMV
jgi:hypothetical protein